MLKTIRGTSLFCGFLFLFVFLAEAAKWSEIKTDTLQIRFNSELKEAAEEVIRQFPAAKGFVEQKLKREIKGPIRIVLYKRHNEFTRLTRTELVMAFAVPSRSLIVIDFSRMREPFTLEDTLRHELAHLALKSPKAIPRWFDEGVAQWVVGGFNEFYPLKGEKTLKAALTSDRLIPFWRIERAFPSDRQNLTLAYEQSKSIVEYLIKRYGEDRLYRLINELQAGSDFDVAFRSVYSVDFREIVRQWKDEVKSQYTWLHFISNNIYEILFFFGALITIVGFLILLIRKRRYVDDKEEDYEYYNERDISDYYNDEHYDR